MNTITEPLPGPYRVEKYKAPIGAANYHVIGNATHEVAYCHRIADAKLLATGPELIDDLTALVEILQANRPGFEPYNEEYVAARVARAEKTMLKAKGGI